MTIENTTFIPTDDDYTAVKELPRNRIRIKVHNEPYRWIIGLQFEVPKDGTYEVMSRTGNRVLIKKIK